jgi:hypothetical protein
MALTAGGGATLLLIQYVAAVWGERAALVRDDLLVMAAICLPIGVWQGYRHSRAYAVQVVRFRQRWRRGRWGEIFGFAIGVALFGAMLGVLCSIVKWLPPAADNAREITLVYIAIGVGSGFIGGFASQLAPITYRVRG